MTLSQFISILRARWWLCALVLGLTVATTLVASLLMPKQYTAAASVVIDIKPDPVSAMAFPQMAMPGFMATQVDIIQSDRVALRVIRDLKLADNLELREQWQKATEGRGSFEHWLSDVLQQKLDVKPSRESSVIQVGYKSGDPQFAAGLANAFAQAYIATTLELRVDPARQFNRFFDTQSKEAREALERAQAKLSAYQREKGIIATDERLDVENARLNELSSQLVQLQALASDSSSRQAQAQAGAAERMQEVLQNPLIGGLKADLSRNEARLKELNARLGDAHPQVVEARANIAELRERIAAETRRVSGGVGVTLTINRQREAQVRHELQEQRAKLLRMKATRDEGQVLVREVESAQRAFDALMARLNQSALEAQTTQSYANVLSTAAVPSEHSSPKLLLNTAISIFLGTLLAVGGALMLELTDRRVRAATDVVEALGLPVLGVLPRPGAKRYTGAAGALLLPRPALAEPDARPAGSTTHTARG